MTQNISKNKIKNATNSKGSSSNEFSLVDSAGNMTAYTYRCKLLRSGKHIHE